MLDFLAECHCFSCTSSSAACRRCSLLSAHCSLLSAISVGSRNVNLVLTVNCEHHCPLSGACSSCKYSNVNLVLTVNCEPHCPLSGACSSCKYSSVLLCLKIETVRKAPSQTLTIILWKESIIMLYIATRLDRKHSKYCAGYLLGILLYYFRQYQYIIYSTVAPPRSKIPLRSLHLYLKTCGHCSGVWHSAVWYSGSIAI